MTPDEFVKSRQSEWSRLAQLVERTHRGARLSAEEIDTLGHLYRAATSDLALAQRDFPRARVTTYLNNLVARAHAMIYRSAALDLHRFAHFYLYEFPRLFRTLAPYTLIAFLLFLLPAFGAGYGLATNPGAASMFGLEQAAATMAEGDLWTRLPPEVRGGMSAAVMTNNIRVTLLAFGGGMTLTLLTVYAMIGNGLNVGGVVGLGLHYGFAGELMTFMSAHGFIELSVIFMAGGAGLKMGWAMLSPGFFTRRDALMAAGREVVQVIFGCVPLLIIAGLIEGFISPNQDIPAVLHWLVGLTTGALLYTYLLGFGHDDPAASARRWLAFARRLAVRA